MPLVLAFGLTVEGNRELLLDAQKVVRRGLELEYEYLAAIAENRVRQTVVSNYNIEDDFY